MNRRRFPILNRLIAVAALAIVALTASVCIIETDGGYRIT